MTAQVTISFKNLDTGIHSDALITASNFFMLMIKYNRFIESGNFFILGYGMTTPIFEAGNSGINAGSYLHEIIDENYTKLVTNKNR